MPCSVEITSLPNLTSCPNPVSKILIAADPDLMTNTNTGGYGLITFQQFLSCFNANNKPIKFVVGDGKQYSPILGTTAFYHPLLVGLGAANGYQLDILISGGLWQNWGDNPNTFTFNPTTGTITGLPTWITGNSLEISLNQ